MPANTAKGWPYVLPGDNVADYPTTSQALATKADTTVPFAMAAGTVQMVISTAAASGTVAVTFPVGRFTQPPIVALGNMGGSGSSNLMIQAQAVPTATGFTAFASYKDTSGTSTSNFPIHWQAVQMLSTASPG